MAVPLGARRQRDHRPVVPQRQPRLQLVGEDLPGPARHDPLSALVATRGEQPDGAEALGRPVPGLDQLERRRWATTRARSSRPPGARTQRPGPRRSSRSRRSPAGPWLSSSRVGLRRMYHLVHDADKRAASAGGDGRGRHARGGGGRSPAAPPRRSRRRTSRRRAWPTRACAASPRPIGTQPPHAAVPLRIQGRPAACGRPRGGGQDAAAPPGPRRGRTRRDRRS